MARVFLNLQVKFNIVQTQVQGGQRMRMRSGLSPRPKLLKSKVDSPHRKEGQRKARKFLVSSGEGRAVIGAQACWLWAHRGRPGWLKVATGRSIISSTNTKGAGADLVGHRCGPQNILKKNWEPFQDWGANRTCRTRRPLGFYS